MARSAPPARFEPSRLAPRPMRRLALVVGPLLWLVALVVLAFVVKRRDAVEAALLVVAASFVVGVVTSSWMRRVRVREERRA